MQSIRERRGEQINI
jgi:glutamate--cysteine ligase catalytic subunit